MRVKLPCLIAFLAMASIAHAQRKIICYFESWAKYRSGAGKYTINSIPANLCTHVLYSFVGINTDGTVKLLDTASDLTDFTSYIRKYSGVKAIVSIGGANEGSSKFSAVVSNSTIRQRFVKNVVSFLEEYGFQGFDVDWEYPNQNGGRSSDKKNFVLLLSELKSAFSSNGYSLSAAVAAEASSASQSYDIPQISKYLDFINVMTYDFNGDWNDYTGMNSPLYPSSKDNSFQRTLNVNASIQYWLSQGAPRNKVIEGLPFYGHTYTLKDPNNHGLHAPTSGPGNAGPYTDEKGTIGYNEMCVALKNSSWHVVRDQQERVPYAYKGNQWVSYDDPTSIREKCVYVNSNNLAGAMIWSIDTDDFRGDCGQENALLNTVNSVLRAEPREIKE